MATTWPNGASKRWQNLNVPSKYEALTDFLDTQPLDESVSVSFQGLAGIVGGLPAGAARRRWWANTGGDPQAAAWLRAGRRVVEVCEGESVVFSPVAKGQNDPGRPLMDGVDALDELVGRSGYGSVLEAVAASTVFLAPETVRQTGGEALLP